MAECQHEFAYTKQTEGELQAAISHTRLGLFAKPTAAALQKYLWNARLSKALRFPLEMAEVVLRNRVTDCLRERYEDWPRSDLFRSHAAEKTIGFLNEALNKVGAHAPAHKVVTELPFGFWAAIVQGRFVENLWRNRSARAFPGLPKNILSGTCEAHIDTLSKWARGAQNLRNDISHLKPVLNRALADDHKDVLLLIRACCPTTAQWTEAHSTVLRELRAGPKAFVSNVGQRSWKDFQQASSEQSVSELLRILDKSSRPYAVVSDGTGFEIVSATQLAGWIGATQIDGLAELETKISVLLEKQPPTQHLPRKASVWEVRHAWLAAQHARVAIITENGRRTEKPLGIIELTDVL